MVQFFWLSTLLADKLYYATLCAYRSMHPVVVRAEARLQTVNDGVPEAHAIAWWVIQSMNAEVTGCQAQHVVLSVRQSGVAICPKTVVCWFSWLLPTSSAGGCTHTWCMARVPFGV